MDTASELVTVLNHELLRYLSFRWAAVSYPNSLGMHVRCLPETSVLPAEVTKDPALLEVLPYWKATAFWVAC